MVDQNTKEQIQKIDEVAESFAVDVRRAIVRAQRIRNMMADLPEDVQADPAYAEYYKMLGKPEKFWKDFQEACAAATARCKEEGIAVMNGGGK